MRFSKKSLDKKDFSIKKGLFLVERGKGKKKTKNIEKNRLKFQSNMHFEKIIFQKNGNFKNLNTVFILFVLSYT